VSFTDRMLAILDRAGLEDEMVARPYPRPLYDPARHFHRWIAQGAVPGHEDGSPSSPLSSSSKAGGLPANIPTCCSSTTAT
jgi:hypothetical protein